MGWNEAQDLVVSRYSGPRSALFHPLAFNWRGRSYCHDSVKASFRLEANSIPTLQPLTDNLGRKAKVRKRNKKNCCQPPLFFSRQPPLLHFNARTHTLATPLKRQPRLGIRSVCQDCAPIRCRVSILVESTLPSSWPVPVFHSLRSTALGFMTNVPSYIRSSASSGLGGIQSAKYGVRHGCVESDSSSMQPPFRRQ